MNVLLACVPGDCGGQKRALGPLELETQEAGSCLTGMLEAELTSGRAASTHDHRVICLVPRVLSTR